MNLHLHLQISGALLLVLAMIVHHLLRKIFHLLIARFLQRQLRALHFEQSA